MGRVQQLSGFEDHLYDMFVAMIFRGLFRIEGKEEDVHFGLGMSQSLMDINLFSFIKPVCPNKHHLHLIIRLL